MTNSESHIFTKDFVLLFISNFIVVSIYFLLMTTMAFYAVSSYGVESSIAGLTASIFLVGGVTGRILTGKFANSANSRKLSIVALVVQLVMCLLYLVSGFGIWFLIIVRFIHGLSFGFTNTLLPALAVESLPLSRIGEGTGYFMLSSSLGVGIGPMMSILVVMGFEYSILFMLCIGLSVVSLIATLLVKAPTKDIACETSQTDSTIKPQGEAGNTNLITNAATYCESKGESEEFIQYKEGIQGESRVNSKLYQAFASIVDTSAFKVSVFMFIVAFSYSSLNAFVNSYAIELNMGVYVPFVFLVYSITLLISRLFTGKIQDKYGDNWVLYPSIISMGIGLIIAAFVSNPVMLLCCGIFMATGFGTCMSVGQAAAIKVSTCKETSRTISTFFLLCDMGCGVGPFILGFVVSGFGYPAMYILCACIAFSGVIYYHFVHGRHQHS